ncbi:MAG: FAD-dependent oxidoreductase, partial [Desulfohalobiaceae bacterium]
NQGAVLQYVLEDGSLQEEYFDMVVLSVGLEPSKEAQDLANLLGFELDHYGFAATSPSQPVSSSKDGIFVTGAFESPMSIPRAVTQASTAATESAKALLPAKNTLTRDKTYPQETDISQEEPRIGVFVCSCGINIAGVVDVQDVAAFARNLPYVELVENNMFTCSTDTQDLIAQKIQENHLNRIVIAACTPRTHEPLFQDTLKEAGLNGYLVEMANIRNQNAWVHQKEKELATAKAKDQVRMAVAKVSRSQPLSELEVRVVQKALVIGGGVAGMSAALELAELGYPVVLLEKSGQLGGNALHLYHSGWNQDMQGWVKGLIQAVLEHSNIEVLTNATLTSNTGSVGSFQSQVKIGNETRTLDYGAAVLATGAKEHKPKGLFLYGQDSRVLTHLEFDQLRRQSPEKTRQAQSVAFIQCVGSRNQERMYCSRICCTHTMHAAIAIKEEDPGKQVFVLYRDIRTYALQEDLYTKARSLGVIFIRYDLEHQPHVQTIADGLLVEAQDPILQQKVQLHVSYLVLASAIIPQENSNLVELYKCGLNQDGFLNEAHPKLRPVDMGVDGLFVAGLCNYPKNISESISQAKAAASRAGVILSRSVMKLDAIKSYVTENCDGCALCLDVCPYQAISLQSATGKDGLEHKKIEINKALCKGCGLCEATCPKDGVFVHGFTLEQLRSQVDALLAGQV